MCVCVFVYERHLEMNRNFLSDKADGIPARFLLCSEVYAIISKKTEKYRKATTFNVTAIVNLVQL